jgi:lipoyl(octanoyl) transferase
MNIARLILDPPAAGSWNMAVDEALLTTAVHAPATTLRFYTWSEPTVSLGYFQSHFERDAHEPSHDCPWVRRATGGGAIVHHHELTYSFVAPLGDRLAGDAAVLYDAFHESLVDCLGAFGVTARLCPTEEAQPRGRAPFLCFQRRTTGDVLCDAAKITGSAQRRHHGAVLQHGSVLLMRSPHAPELPGVAELTGRVIAYPELIAAWAPSVARRLGLELEPVELSPETEAAAQEAAQVKFSAPGWNQRR